MKRIYFIFISILMFAHAVVAVEPTTELFAEAPQTAEQIRAAAREQVISALSLSKEARKKFEPIYDEYRADLAAAIQTANEQIDDVTPLNGMKVNLMSIAATAQVKLDYIDRFAEVLSSGQIYQLYNSEGTIAWAVREKANDALYVDRGTLLAISDGADADGYVSMTTNQPRVYVVKDDGSLVPADAVPMPEVKQQYYRFNGKRTPLLSPVGQTVECRYGKVGGYHTLRVDDRINVIVSPSATSVTARLDRAFADMLQYEYKNGVLSFSMDRDKCSAWTGERKIDVIVPLSSQLSCIDVDGYSTVTIKTSHRAGQLTINIDGRSKVTATGHLIAQKVTVNINGYSTFKANVLTTYKNGSIMENGMVVYNLNGRSLIKGTVVAKNFVAKSNGYSEMNLGTEIHDARFVLNGRSKCNLNFSGSQLQMDLDGYSEVVAKEIVIGQSAVFELDGRSSITANELRTPQERERGGSFTAKLNGYSKMNVGSGRATEGYVSVTGRSEFNAPQLDVATFTVEANDYSTADVHCSGKLRAITTSQQARINFSGNCRVDAVSPTIIRK